MFAVVLLLFLVIAGFDCMVDSEHVSVGVIAVVLFFPIYCSVPMYGAR